MAQNFTYNCDVCGVARGPENHWLVVTGGDDEEMLTVRPWSSLQMLEDYNVEQRKRDRPDMQAHIRHICGQACILKLVSQKVESWKK